MRDADNVLGELRAVFAAAAEGGADDATVAAASARVVSLLLELEEWRRGDRDPRRKRTIAFARRVLRAHDLGVPVQDLCTRFSRSRSQIYRLLDVAELHATNSRETGDIESCGA